MITVSVILRLKPFFFDHSGTGHVHRVLDFGLDRRGLASRRVGASGSSPPLNLELCLQIKFGFHYVIDSNKATHIGISDTKVGRGSRRVGRRVLVAPLRHRLRLRVSHDTPRDEKLLL